MKVVMCFATGYEEIEALSVVDILRRAGVEVTLVGVTGELVESARGVVVKMDKLIDDIDFSGYQMLILPGGLPGVDYLYESEEVKKQVDIFLQSDRYVAAICAAPRILGRLGVLEGKKVVCYPGNEKYLEGAQIGDERVCVSGNIVTAVGAGASFEFGLKLAEILVGEQTAKKVAEAMLI